MLSIADKKYFSLTIMSLVICFSGCSKKTKVEPLSKEETAIKAFEKEKIKPAFIEEANFFQSTNTPTQITEVPKSPLPPIDRSKFKPFPETYDPFAIVFLDDNGGVSERKKIWYTFDYDKDKASWAELDHNGAAYINYHQSRWGGKIPKWFKASIEVIGAGGSEEVVYINTLKQKKDVYLIVQGSTLIDEYTSSADVIDESCTEPKDGRFVQSKAGDGLLSTNESDDSREDAVITESSKYKVDNAAFNKCLQIEYNTRVYSYWSNGFKPNQPPHKKPKDPINEEGEASPSRYNYNI